MVAPRTTHGSGRAALSVDMSEYSRNIGQTRLIAGSIQDDDRATTSSGCTVLSQCADVLEGPPR